MTFRRFVFATALLSSGCPASACDLCSIYAATEAQAESGSGFFAGIAEQFTYFNTFQSGGRDAPNPDAEHLSSFVSQAFAGYNLNNRIGLQLTVPLIFREYGREGAHGSEAGLGDLSFIGNFRLYEGLTEHWTFRWTGVAGIKFPTGDSGHLNPADQDFAAGIGGHDLTLGSGSFDGLVGTGLFARWRRVFVSANVQYAIRTEGDFGYQFANDWIWFGGPGVYALLNHKHTLAAQLVVSGESKGQDTLQGVSTQDTAETIVYLGPQLAYTWSTRLSAQLGIDIPVSIDSTGEQVVPDWRIRAAVTWRF